MEKLNSFSKILLATGQINYLASIIDGVNNEMKLTGLASRPVHEESVKRRDDLLEDVVKRLAAIMEEMVNLINNHGCFTHIDERISKVPFEIVVLGMDNGEEYYEEGEA